MLCPIQRVEGKTASGRLLGRGDRAFKHAHDVGFLHDQKILAVDLNFRARPFPEQYALASLEFERDELAAFIAGAWPDGDDFALLRLFLDGAGMMIPPFDFSSASRRRMTTRSCNGRNFMGGFLNAKRPGSVLMPIGAAEFSALAKWRRLALVTRECYTMFTPKYGIWRG